MELENKIYLGDSFELMKQIPDRSIDLIMTDIPYLYLEKKPSPKSHLYKAVMQTRTDLEDCEIDKGVDISWLDEACRIMKKINIYIWMSKFQIPEYLNYFVNKKASYEFIVWLKPDAMPLHNCKYNSDKEYCLYFRKEAYCQPKDNYSAKTYFLRNKNIQDKQLYGHPTCKPVDMIKILIENSTHEGDLVFDPFLGSGTTCVAAWQLKRKYLGIEKNEEFYKVAVNRVEEEKKHLDLPLTF